jgi:hypothetical protein
MKVTVEAQAEPEWDESHEDPAFGLANETEWMKRAELRVLAESGIDTSEIQWLERGSHPGRRGSVDDRRARGNSEGNPRSGLATSGLNAAFQCVDSGGAACVKYSFYSSE